MERNENLRASLFVCILLLGASCFSREIQLEDPKIVSDNQLDDDHDNMINAFRKLQTEYYNNVTGLWDHSQWWCNANTVETIANSMQLLFVSNNSASYSDIIVEMADILDTALLKTTLDETLTGRYDDELWWLIGWVRAYQSRMLVSDLVDCKNCQDYITRAVGIWNSVKDEAWDNICNGGLWWSYMKHYKNAITNELFLVSAVRLFEVSSNSVELVPLLDKSEYLEWANKIWTWFLNSGMINSKHLVNDGLDFSTCSNINGIVWSYNQAVILGGMAGIIEYNLDSQNGFYLSQYDKQQIVDNSIKILGNNMLQSSMKALSVNGILTESCESTYQTCDGDQRMFKGVYARYICYILSAKSFLSSASTNSVIEFVNANAASAFSNDNNDNLYGLHWAGPFSYDSTDATTQTAAIDLLNTKLFVNNF